MNPNFILFTIIPFILMFAIAVGMPFYRLSILQKAGEKKLSLVKKSARLSYVTSAVAVVVMLLSIMFDFGRLNFIIPYCSVLGLFVSIRESNFLPVNGVYEKLLITGSDILFYDDIISLPLEELPQEEKARYPDNVLVVVTKKRGKRQLTFDNANELAEVLSLLKKAM